MAVRAALVTDHASRILLEGLVDYAGLYPPASVSMAAAVRNYAHYRASGSGWMLGRFVCPANALEEFSRHADPLLPRDAGAIPWRLSAVASADVDADLLAIGAFNARHRVCFEECGALVDAYEVRVSGAEDITRVHDMVPTSLTTYLELPLDRAVALLPQVAATGRRAKMRTGGVTSDAFPQMAAIIAFLQQCVALGVAAKATAGLHHPLGGQYRLSYAADAPVDTMYGYLNVFLSAALLAAGGAPADAERLLVETNPAQLTIDDVAVTWRAEMQRAVSLDREHLQRTRQHVLVSFGSCSFTEPVDEVRALGWI